MSEARAITNLIGNAVATLAVARWTGTLDLVQVGRTLDGHGGHDGGRTSDTEPSGVLKKSA